MNPKELLTRWNEAWESGLWAVAWGRALDGLNAAEAAWQPQPGRHSIWQIVEHMLFWRDEGLRPFLGQPKSSADERARRNFPNPTDVGEAAWQRTRAAFHESHRRIAALLESGSVPAGIFYLLPHDAYHIGQIMYARALLGKPANE